MDTYTHHYTEKPFKIREYHSEHDKMHHHFLLQHISVEPILMSDFLKTFWQYLIPKHLLSTWVHALMNLQTPWLRRWIIQQLVRWYHINLNEAQRTQIDDYTSVNDFFTRALNPDMRPIDTNPQVMVSPADGTISQAGTLKHNQLIHAKGHHYTVEALLGGDVHLARQFYQGDFAVIYLSPKDYHRIHMPFDGQLLSMMYVPGDLFAVNPATVNCIPDLFARNERLVISFATTAGPMVLVMVGAIFVGSMETVWQGKITPNYGKTLAYWDYQAQNIELKKGQEIGRFNMGSTVIMLTAQGKTQGFTHHSDEPSTIHMGEVITHCLISADAHQSDTLAMSDDIPTNSVTTQP